MAVAPPIADRDRHVLFLSTPALWPAWPFLPVVRRTAEREEYGLLYDAWACSQIPGYRATVFLGNLFLLPMSEAQFLALPKEVFDTADEIFARGWRVD